MRRVAEITLFVDRLIINSILSNSPKIFRDWQKREFLSLCSSSSSSFEEKEDCDKKIRIIDLKKYLSKMVATTTTATTATAATTMN